MSELPEPETFGDYAQWPGRDVLDASGERLGEVQEIYLDDATDRPEWVLVMTSDGSRFVPLAGAKVEGETIRVVHSTAAVAAAPTLEPSKELTQAEERRLYDHYSVPVSEEASETLLPDPEQPAPEPEAVAPEPEVAAPEPQAAAPEPDPEPEPEPEPAPEPAAPAPQAVTPEPQAAEAEPEAVAPEPVPEPTPAPEPPKAAAPPPPPPPPPAPASSGPPPQAIAGAIAALILLLIIMRRRSG